MPGTKCLDFPNFTAFPACASPSLAHIAGKVCRGMPWRSWSALRRSKDAWRRRPSIGNRREPSELNMPKDVAHRNRAPRFRARVVTFVSMVAQRQGHHPQAPRRDRCRARAQGTTSESRDYRHRASMQTATGPARVARSRPRPSSAIRTRSPAGPGARETSRAHSTPITALTMCTAPCWSRSCS